MMLRLTQILSGDSKRQVWVQSSHIVAIYPDVTGCHIELVTNVDPNEPVLHVLELADQIGQSCGPWSGFNTPTETKP
jgi:hypothetical protein